MNVFGKVIYEFFEKLLFSTPFLLVLLRKTFYFRTCVSFLDFCNVDLRVNITFGPHEERMMLSGTHTVADIFCCYCGQIVGWKYVISPAIYFHFHLSLSFFQVLTTKLFILPFQETAHENSQKYKEGKFVLERYILTLISAIIFFLNSVIVGDLCLSFDIVCHSKNRVGRGRIVDGADSEFYIDTRPTLSDTEDA